MGSRFRPRPAWSPSGGGWRVVACLFALALTFAAGAAQAQTPAAFSSAVVNGDQLTITFDKALDATSTPEGRAFRVNWRNGTGTATVSGMTVKVTLDTAVVHGEVVSVGYAVPSDDRLQDADGFEVAAFTGSR